MSTPYPPQPRRLMRDPSHKLIGGVCSGLAKYLNMDVNLVRILTVLISLFTGIPIVLYIIALFVLPEERTEHQPPYVSGPQPNAYGAGHGAQNFQPPAYGQPAQPSADDVWGTGGAPWDQPQNTAPASAPAASAPAPASAAPAPAASPASAGPPAAEQTWQQPAWQQPETEPTLYDTAPAESNAIPAESDATPTESDATPTESNAAPAELAEADESTGSADSANPADAAESTVETKRAS